MSATAVNHEITPMKTVGTFLNGRACSDTLFHIINGAFGEPLPVEERAALPLAGGIMQHGFQCGMIWGAALAAGAQAYRLFGPGPKAEANAIGAAQRVVAAFRARHNTINCIDITNIDATSSNLKVITYFLIKGGSIGCFRMAARFAPLAFGEIDGAFSESPIDARCVPMNCAAMVARRMGASDQHAVMAAGLAGGVGLSGGGCGALGAAIWIRSMDRILGGGGKVDFKDPEALDLIDRFAECTDHEFECSTIAGQTFEDIDAHVNYMCQGGCSKLMDVLAAE